MSPGRCQTILATALLSLCICVSANAFQSGSVTAVVELGDGSEMEADLQTIDRDTATFSVDGSAKAISVRNINRIRFSDSSNEPSPVAYSIMLVDGTKLSCLAFTVTDRELVAKTESEIGIRISTRLIDHVRFPNIDPEFAKNWEKTVKRQRESDALVVSRDSKLQMIDGIVGDVSAEDVSFTVGDRTANVKRSRLAGMLFYRRATDELAPSVFVLELTDGSAIEVQSLTIKNDHFEVRSVVGSKFVIDPESISNLDFSSKREMWLTDLEPATNDWSPLMSGSSSHWRFCIAEKAKRGNGKNTPTDSPSKAAGNFLSFWPGNISG